MRQMKVKNYTDVLSYDAEDRMSNLRKCYDDSAIRDTIMDLLYNYSNTVRVEVERNGAVFICKRDGKGGYTRERK